MYLSCVVSEILYHSTWYSYSTLNNGICVWQAKLFTIIVCHLQIQSNNSVKWHRYLNWPRNSLFTTRSISTLSLLCTYVHSRRLCSSVRAAASEVVILAEWWRGGDGTRLQLQDTKTLDDKHSRRKNIFNI